MELQSLNVKLADGTGMGNLSTAQVQALFAKIMLVKDNDIHDPAKHTSRRLIRLS